MSKIEWLYQAYCTEQDNAPIHPASLRLEQILLEMLPHKEYLEVERLINACNHDSDRDFFFAGFRAAAKLWTEAN
jgi:hypothetical protein